ncbi:MAG: flagellar biosynthetic protein FliP, partial [Rhodobacteraceae bacterium]|nr:flagellar biosynthetic protein FliP [Paracoccaceae bacterium]
MIFRPVLVALALWLLGGQAAWAQSIGIDFGQGGSLSGSSLKLIALITGLSLAPGALLMLTCFPFMVTVLAILRQGIGLQQSPPNMLM